MKIIEEDMAMTATPTASAAPAPSKGKSFAAAFEAALTEAEEWKSGRIVPITTPFAGVTEALDGGYAHGLHIVIGNTGSGKTAFATALMAHAAQAGHEVAYYALEIDEREAALRIANELPGFPPRSLVARGKARETRDELRAIAAPVLASRITIYTPNPTAIDLEAEVLDTGRELRAKADADGHGRIPLLVLDYLQLLGIGGEDEARSRIGRVMAGLREAARVHRIAVVVLSSIGRGAYEALGPEGLAKGGLVHGSSTMRNTVGVPERFFVGKESGDIEFTAETVSALVKSHDEGDRRIVAFVVAKNRHASPSWAGLAFERGRWKHEAAASVQLDGKGRRSESRSKAEDFGL